MSLKRILAGILSASLVLTVALSGCNNGQSGSADPSSSTEKGSSAASSTEDQAAGEKHREQEHQREKLAAYKIPAGKRVSSGQRNGKVDERPACGINQRIDITAHHAVVGEQALIAVKGIPLASFAAMLIARLVEASCIRLSRRAWLQYHEGSKQHGM